MDEDIKAFLVESYENISQIETDLVTLEKNPTHQDLLEGIYRSLHTIKGNCGFMAFPTLEALTHSGENLLSCLRDGQLQLNAEITSSLLQLLDAMQQICAQIEAIGQEGDVDYSGLIQTLNQLQSGDTGDEGGFCTNVTINRQKEIPKPAPTNPERSKLPCDREELMSVLTTPNTVKSIRVDINLLDKLMNLVGELVLVRNQIQQFSTLQDETAFVTTSQQLNRLTTELQEGVMKTRMQPISTITRKFPRVVRDVAIATEKQVQLEIEGEETELDKTIIEAIKDPLTHLLRNCVDHGIESPDIRQTQGKSATGRLRLQAFHESGYVTIEISDDGAGIDSERLKEKALSLGLITPNQANRLSDTDALNLIFLPGFSTANCITRLSGRGVGMDVVKTDVEKVGGTVDVHTQLGLGTTFKLKIPLTLAIIPALIVTSGGDCYTIPQTNLLELVRLQGEQADHGIEYVHKAPVYRLRGKLLPLVYLNRELELTEWNPEPAHPQSETMLNIVVLQVDNFTFGLVVDAINDTQEIVVKPLGKLLKETPCFAGATILGDGKVALILDVFSLASRAGVLSDEQKNALIQQEMSSQSTIETVQMLLLFEALDNSRMAIPLSRVVRLEEFPRSAIEQVGDRQVIQYRDQILYLVNFANVFQSFGSSQRFSAANPKTAVLEGDPLQVVVVACQSGRQIGLVVQRMVDIVMEDLCITGEATRPGVQAIAVIQGQVTELLDIEAI
jgi:two-component system chemotaxis sensor kinase CheA